MATQIQIRRDTAANWTSTDPTLASGEIGYETNTGKMKIGDGSTAWTSLAYFATLKVKVTETKTDNYSVLTTDVGKTLVMNSASEKTFSLPSVDSGDVGLYFTFAKIAAGKLIIDAADTDVILDSGAGDTIYNDVSGEVYASITLQLVSATLWTVVGGIGTWITTD